MPIVGGQRFRVIVVIKALKLSTELIVITTYHDFNKSKGG